MLRAVFLPVVLAAVFSSRPAVATEAGWGPWRFGQSLDVAIAAAPSIRWNSYSLNECRERIEVGGCLLVSTEDSFLPPVDAIRLRPNLKFDKHGQLVQVDLQYGRDSDITPAQCLDIFGRIVDWQTSENGPLLADLKKPLGKGDVAAGWVSGFGTTPRGLSYLVHRDVKKNGGYISGFFREGVKGSAVERSIFSALIYVSGEPHCFVTLNFDLPK